MELAQQFSGQASDVDGYISLMQSSLGSEDGTSTFGAEDLRADLDSINIGSQLTADTNLADLMRTYYADLSDYDRAYRFTALSFGNVNTGNTNDFRETVYSTLTSDAGMQLLLYLKGMWTSDGWTINSDAEPALAGCGLRLCGLPFLRRQRGAGQVRRQRPQGHVRAVLVRRTERPGRK